MAGAHRGRRLLPGAAASGGPPATPCAPADAWPRRVLELRFVLPRAWHPGCRYRAGCWPVAGEALQRLKWRSSLHARPSRAQRALADYLAQGRPRLTTCAGCRPPAQGQAGCAVGCTLSSHEGLGDATHDPSGDGGFQHLWWPLPGRWPSHPCCMPACARAWSLMPPASCSAGIGAAPVVRHELHGAVDEIEACAKGRSPIAARFVPGAWRRPRLSGTELVGRYYVPVGHNRNQPCGGPARRSPGLASARADKGGWRQEPA